MIKVQRLGPLGALLALVVVFALLFSLPIFLAALGATLLIRNILRKTLFAPKKNAQVNSDPFASKPLENEKIGRYRIKQNPQQPDVIEVLP
jgi:hypothetical protein